MFQPFYRLSLLNFNEKFVLYKQKLATSDPGMGGAEGLVYIYCIIIFLAV